MGGDVGGWRGDGVMEWGGMGEMGLGGEWGVEGSDR